MAKLGRPTRKTELTNNHTISNSERPRTSMVSVQEDKSLCEKHIALDLTATNRELRRDIETVLHLDNHDYRTEEGSPDHRLWTSASPLPLMKSKLTVQRSRSDRTISEKRLQRGSI